MTIALTPLLLALFQQVSLVSPLANAFAIPVVSLIVVPLALAGTVLPVDAVLQLAHFVMACCMYVLDWMSSAPDAVWQQHAPPEWAIVTALAGTVWLLFPRGVPARWLGAVACLPLFLVLPAAPRPGELRLAVLDVGQGLAVVVRTATHTLLYDTGPAYGPGADSGNRIIAPYLRAVGVRRLDGLVVSHDDSDHAGGALSVLQALPVAWLMSSLPDMDPLPLIADEAFHCYAGQSWEWDGVRFDVMHPDRESYDARIKNNDRGCVLKLTAPGGSVLIPADVERRTEEAMLARNADLAADIVIAGHHGSKTSSTPAFVEAVRPRTVIFRGRLSQPLRPSARRRRRALSRNRQRRVSHRQRWRGAREHRPRRRYHDRALPRAPSALLARRACRRSRFRRRARQHGPIKTKNFPDTPLSPSCCVSCIVAAATAIIMSTSSHLKLVLPPDAAIDRWREQLAAGLPAGQHDLAIARARFRGAALRGPHGCERRADARACPGNGANPARSEARRRLRRCGAASSGLCGFRRARAVHSREVRACRCGARGRGRAHGADRRALEPRGLRPQARSSRRRSSKRCARCFSRWCRTCAWC